MEVDICDWLTLYCRHNLVGMLTLKERFERFMSTLQGVENIDTLMEQCDLPGRQRADYLALSRRVIIEHKSLEFDPHDKVQAFIDGILRLRGTWVPARFPLFPLPIFLPSCPTENTLRSSVKCSRNESMTFSPRRTNKPTTVAKRSLFRRRSALL
jgi:hypothetical protein